MRNIRLFFRKPGKFVIIPIHSCIPRGAGQACDAGGVISGYFSVNTSLIHEKYTIILSQANKICDYSYSFVHPAGVRDRFRGYFSVNISFLKQQYIQAQDNNTKAIVPTP